MQKLILKFGVFFILLNMEKFKLNQVTSNCHAHRQHVDSCRIARLFHGPLSQCPIFPFSMDPLSRCPIVPLRHCAIVPLSHCHTAPLAISQSPHGRIVLSSHCATVRPVAPLPYPHSPHPHLWTFLTIAFVISMTWSFPFRGAPSMLAITNSISTFRLQKRSVGITC